MGLRLYIANRWCHQTLQDGGRIQRLYLADQRDMGLWCDRSLQLQARPSRQSIYRNCCLYWLIRSGGRWCSQECHTWNSARLYAACRRRIIPPYTTDGTLHVHTTRLPHGRSCHRGRHRRTTQESQVRIQCIIAQNNETNSINSCLSILHSINLCNRAAISPKVRIRSTRRIYSSTWRISWWAYICLNDAWPGATLQYGRTALGLRRILAT